MTMGASVATREIGSKHAKRERLGTPWAAGFIHLLRLTDFLCRALDLTTGACGAALRCTPTADVAAFGLALVELLTRANRVELTVATVPAVSRRQQPFPDPRDR